MGNDKLVRQIAVLKIFKAAVEAAADTRNELTNAAFCRDYFSSLFNSFEMTELEAVSMLVSLAAVMDDKKFCRVFVCSSEALASTASDSEVIQAIKSGQDIWDLL